MTCFVIGCGDSGKDWFTHPHDVSIGSNDSIKHGRDTDYLVLINALQGFKREKERLDLIQSSKAKILTNSDSWKSMFRDYEKIKLVTFHKYLKKGMVYSSKSSPFVAASIAFNMGAKDIVLWGVDMNTHHLFNPENKLRDYEVRKFESLAKLMKAQGTMMCVSSAESALSKVLPVYRLERVTA